VYSALKLVPRLAPLVVQHLVAYVELVAEDSSAFARGLAQRLIAGAVALLAAIFTVLIGCLWIVSAVWDTAWRWPVIGALLVLFAAIATVGTVVATRRWPAGQEPFLRLRTEWNRDQVLVRDLSDPNQPQEIEA
jgi:uncharacterized membrane protein YqjE